MTWNRDERGQTLVINVVALMAMLGFAMLVVDGGTLLYAKRNMQGAADAAALAGVRSFPTGSSAEAAGAATDYATSMNGPDGASVEQLVATQVGGVCTIDGVTKVLPPYSVCVTVQRDQAGVFFGLVDISSAEVRASAIASVSQLQETGQWLPFGVQTSLLDLDDPTTLAVTPGAKEDNVGGMINLSGPGAADIVDIIEGTGYVPPIEVGDDIDTQTGAVQVIENAFEDRIGDNTDAFYDVFGQAADGTWYVKDGDSPRLGLMPVAEDTNGEWPLVADASMTVKGFVLVYIGRTSGADSMYACPGDKDGKCPGTTGSGSNQNDPLRVYLTPVNAPLPEDFDATFGDYDATNVSPVIYRMTS